MAWIKVKNKKGTSRNPSPVGSTSWLDHWEKIKGVKASSCEALNCFGNADVGGHVIKSGEGGKEYILPICYSHNNRSETEEYEAWESDLVPVI